MARETHWVMVTQGGPGVVFRPGAEWNNQGYLIVNTPGPILYVDEVNNRVTVGHVLDEDGDWLPVRERGVFEVFFGGDFKRKSTRVWVDRDCVSGLPLTSPVCAPTHTCLCVALNDSVYRVAIPIVDVPLGSAGTWALSMKTIPESIRRIIESEL